jgi:hypothetical protein
VRTGEGRNLKDRKDHELKGDRERCCNRCDSRVVALIFLIFLTLAAAGTAAAFFLGVFPFKEEAKTEMSIGDPSSKKNK